jgi:hypothetical protein
MNSTRQVYWRIILTMNAIKVIRPYRAEGMWVFDDEAVGLSQEPFVGGADLIIDRLVGHIPDAEHGFNLIFSADPFPGYQHQFEWRRAEMRGNWYFCADLNAEGWLCPALFRYFEAAPPMLYIEVRPRAN